jgi:hypothetical protein
LSDALQEHKKDSADFFFFFVLQINFIDPKIYFVQRKINFATVERIFCVRPDIFSLAQEKTLRQLSLHMLLSCPKSSLIKVAPLFVNILFENILHYFVISVNLFL